MIIFKEEVTLKDDEYWWGGNVEDGKSMPYKDSFSRNLNGDLLYNQGVPFLISNKGRYIWSDKPFAFSFGEGKLVVEGSAEFIINEGKGGLKETFLEASFNFFPASQQSPDASFFAHPQFNTWMEMTHEPTQEKVLKFAKEIIQNGFTPGILMIDDGWQENFSVWNFHPGRFPNPKEMMKELKALGFKVMLWLCPFVSPDSSTFRMLASQGYLIRDEEGEAVIRKWWNGHSALLDCSNEDAVKWLHKKMDYLMNEYAIDGFKLDGGDPQYYLETDVCNKPLLPNEQSQVWAEIGLNYPYNEYRACWKLGGQALVQRLSDKNHSWDALKSLIPNGIAQGIMGYSFVCPDMIGGGQYDDLQNPDFQWDQELFVRYAQCSALFPMMQFSTAPWRVLDDEHLVYCLDAVAMHSELTPYILELTKHAATTGEPIVRNMAYEFGQDEYATITDQFMLGSSILVAPVLEKGAEKRMVVFPAGTWLGDDETIVHGPCQLEVTAPISRLPFYRKID